LWFWRSVVVVLVGSRAGVVVGKGARQPDTFPAVATPDLFFAASDQFYLSDLLAASSTGWNIAGELRS
jgi:hypothetical protein